MAENLSKLLAAGATDEVELVLFIEDACGGKTVDVGVVSEVVAEGVDGEDDACPTVVNPGLFPQPVLQGVCDEVAELSESVRLFSEDIAQHSREGKNPVAMGDG